jgi:hypothetical protein
MDSKKSKDHVGVEMHHMDKVSKAQHGRDAQHGRTRTTWTACGRLRARMLALRQGTGAGDAGMSTSEYAVGTIAACAFAAVLYKVVTSGPVAAALQAVVEKALNAKF